MIKTVRELMDAFHQDKEQLPYVTLKADGSYAGWVSDFRFRVGNQAQTLALDLNQNNDRFLMFVLAVVWSRSGPWENSAFFVAHLKLHGLDDPQLWCDPHFVEQQRRNRERDAQLIPNQIEGASTRKKVAFRKDIFASIALLAQHWDAIQNSLHACAQQNDFMPFAEQLRNLAGLGTNGRKILIKIPLILREFRCQEIYPAIPGQLCCVPDERVKVAAKALIDMRLSPAYPALKNVMRASAQIYDVFGDLYDLPLFAFYDLQLGRSAA